MRKETINAGLRFGPFRRFSLDLLWSFNNDYDFDWNTFDWNYNSLTGFYHGVELDLYIRNAVRFGIAAAFYPSEKTPLNVSGDSARYLRAFFTYNFDRFK